MGWKFWQRRRRHDGMAALANRAIAQITPTPDYDAVDRALRASRGRILLTIDDSIREWRQQPHPAGVPAIDRGEAPEPVKLNAPDALDDDEAPALATCTVCGHRYDPGTDSWIPLEPKVGLNG